jgi:HD-GYP domain-containing protein (c-di-GMP phosphodiesterase class II)
MIAVQVNKLEPGNVVAETIRHNNGATILVEGAALTESYITRLKKFGIPFVMIKESEGVFVPVSVEKRPSNPEVRWKQRELRSKEIVRHKLIHLLDTDNLSGRMSNELMENRFRRIFRNILLDISSHPKVIDQLGALWETDRFLFDHSVNVAVMSGMLGIANGYDNSRLLDLTVGALLFDIGMTRLPESLFSSNRSLTEQERKLLENHTTKGYQILMDIEGISDSSAKCALLHHERYDGFGYPHRVKGFEIPEYVQIVAISDVYDALISPRHYRNAYNESEATELLFAAGNLYFDTEVVKLFFDHISIYPEARMIQLSSGQIGVVSSTRSSMSHRPVVKIVREADGTKVRDPYEMDLTVKHDVFIVHTFSGT